MMLNSRRRPDHTVVVFFNFHVPFVVYLRKIFLFICTQKIYLHYCEISTIFCKDLFEGIYCWKYRNRMKGQQVWNKISGCSCVAFHLRLIPSYVTFFNPFAFSSHLYFLPLRFLLEHHNQLFLDSTLHFSSTINTETFCLIKRHK